MPEKSEKKKWSEEAKLIDGTTLYIGTADDHGHRGHTGDLAIAPWLRDAASDAKGRNPGYRDKIANVYRDFMAVGAKVRLYQLDDPAKATAWHQALQLLFDHAEQSWELQQFAAMGQYADSCETILRVHADAKNWMHVTKHLTKMKQRVSDGLLIEPHRGRVEEIIRTYAELLKNAKVE